MAASARSPGTGLAQRHLGDLPVAVDGSTVGVLHDPLDAPHEVGHLVAQQRHLLERLALEHVGHDRRQGQDVGDERLLAGMAEAEHRPAATLRPSRRSPSCRTCRSPRAGGPSTRSRRRARRAARTSRRRTPGRTPRAPAGPGRSGRRRARRGTPGRPRTATAGRPASRGTRPARAGGPGGSNVPMRPAGVGPSVPSVASTSGQSSRPVVYSCAVSCTGAARQLGLHGERVLLAVRVPGRCRRRARSSRRTSAASRRRRCARVRRRAAEPARQPGERAAAGIGQRPQVGGDLRGVGDASGEHRRGGLVEPPPLEDRWRAACPDRHRRGGAAAAGRPRLGPARPAPAPARLRSGLRAAPIRRRGRSAAPVRPRRSRDSGACSTSTIAEIGVPASSPCSSPNCHWRPINHSGSPSSACRPAVRSDVSASGSRRDHVTADGSVASSTSSRSTGSSQMGSLMACLGSRCGRRPGRRPVPR